MTTFKKLLRPISALSVLALGSALSFTVARRPLLNLTFRASLIS